MLGTRMSTWGIPPGMATATAEAVGPPVTVTDDDAMLVLARERFKQCVEAEAEYRRLALEDLSFYAGDQWPDDVERGRQADKRPCLTINRLPQFVHQVSNQMRQDKPAPKVSPVDDEADPQTAEVIQGLIRHIEQQSKADSVRSYAGFYAVVAGRGYYRVLTEYTDPYSFDQELYIRRVKNPATVYMDPSAQQADYSDANWCFIVEDLTEDEFKAQYPDAELSSAENFRSTGDSDPVWRYEGGIRIAEYFYKVMETVTIVAVQHPETGELISMPLEQAPPGIPVARSRQTKIPRVKWCKLNGAEILEQRDWPGQWIPVIPVLGEEFDVDGETQLFGMVRNAKDPQRMLNYWESAKTEMIALAPKAPWIGAEGQFENHEKEWAQANTRNFAYLQYKPKSVGQELIGPPQRQVYEPPIQAISLAQAQTVDHLKASTGIYDASLGNRSNETAGIAIQQRQIQGDVANYHFIDNLAASITHEARILVDLIPKIYDRPGRVARIIGEDNSERKVVLNQPYQEQGIERIYDLNTGRYDVVVGIGPSYATKRQESADAMLQFASISPEMLPRFADLIVENMDWPGAQAIADRIRPPDVPPKGQQPIPPQIQAQMQALSQQNQQLTTALNETVSLLNSKQLELQSKERMQTQAIESKERIAAQSDQIKLTTEAAKLGSQEDIALMHAQVQALSERLKLLQAQAPVEATQNPPAPPAMPAQVVSPQVQPEPQQPVNGGERPPLESFEIPY
jgi:Phage P22-like portal protein